MLMISLGGVVVGPLLLPSMAIAGLAILTASAALALFSSARLYSATIQQKQWGQKDAPNEIKEQKVEFNPAIYGDMPVKARICRAYYKNLQIPQDNHEAFVRDFFDAQQNPLHEFMRNLVQKRFLQKSIPPVISIVSSI